MHPSTSHDELSIPRFLTALDASLWRGVQGVAVVVLHGLPQQLVTVQDAIDYLKEYADAQPSPVPAMKYIVLDARARMG